MGIIGSRPFSRITKINDLFYELEFANLDFDYAIPTIGKYLSSGRSPDLPRPGACSCIKNSTYFGRNFDWYYNNDVQFLIKVPRTPRHYASIGISSGLSIFTKKFVKFMPYLNLYKILPYLVLDGINEYGVAACVNTCPKEDKGKTYGTNPNAKVSISTGSVVRYVLDNYKSATEAVEGLKKDVNIYGAYGSDLKEEFHFFITDVNDSYIVETINNEIKVFKCPDDKPPYLTNFHIHGTEMEKEEPHNLIWESLSPHSAGVERYNLITENYAKTSTVEGMFDVLKMLKYSKTYDLSNKPFWKTEYVRDYRYDGGTVAKYGNVTLNDVRNETDKYKIIIDTILPKYKSFTRDDCTVWISTHSSVYDLQNKKLYLVLQEDFGKVLEYQIDAGKEEEKGK